jgi:hypothetical protein
MESGVSTPLPLRKMAGPIDTGARADGRTDLDTLPVESTESGADHSRLEFVRPDEGTDKRLFLTARMGAAPRPFAQLIFPLTPGAIELADARGFTGVAFDARGVGRYDLLFDSYGIGDRGSFKAPFVAGESAKEVRIPFDAFRSSDPKAMLDLARLRALIVQLDGEPGGTAWLELRNLRFYQ